MSTDRISVRLDPKVRRKLREQASLARTHESDIVRAALKQYLQVRGKHESCYELARRIGIIGVIKNAPPDLATNCKHFNGFGR